MSEPAHLTKARSYIGFQERPGNRGIEEFIELAHVGNIGDAWCAIFANAMLEAVGLRGTRSALARSFERNANFERLSTPKPGCIVTFWRNSPTSGQGHVGFYIGETATEINILSGNDDDKVQIDGHPKSRHTGYWWPKLGVVVDTKRFTNITATVFADTTLAYQDVPPGHLNRPGVALPFFFKGARPKVRVTYKGKSVVCEIIDQGPWNQTVKSKGLPGDPYWETGARPLAEKQFAEQTVAQNGKVPTNKAGIDLTPAAADAIALPGKGLVDWEFVTQQESTVTDEEWKKSLADLLTNINARLERLERAALPAPEPVETVPVPVPPATSTDSGRATDFRTGILGALLGILGATGGTAGVIDPTVAVTTGTSLVAAAAGGLPGILIRVGVPLLKSLLGRWVK